LRHLRIRTKLLLLFGWLALVSIFLTGWTSYRSAKAALEEVTFQRLTTIRETNKQEIESYIKDIRSHLITIASTPDVVEATAGFSRAFRDLTPGRKDAGKLAQYRAGLRAYYQREFLPRLQRTTEKPLSAGRYLPVDPARVRLQYHYIAANPYPVEDKNKFIEANDGSAYSRIHGDIHTAIRSHVKTQGFYDLYLIDARTGDILYNYSKDPDLGTNLLTGPYRNTNLARLFQDVRYVSRQGFAKLADFEFYEPSFGKPTAFIAAPILRGNQTIGVLAAQVSIDRINDLMTGHRNWKAEGLGDTGETYLIGADYLMRNDARSLLENPDRYFDRLAQQDVEAAALERVKRHRTSVLYQAIRSEGALDALRGNTATRVFDDYRGVSVLGSYAPVWVQDTQWVIMAKINADEAFAPIKALRDHVQFLALLVTIFSGVVGLIFARSLTRPIQLLAEGAEDLGKGNLSRRVPVMSRDELGLLTSSFNQMAENLQRAEHQLREAMESELRIAREIQMGILPGDLPALTRGTPLDIHAVLEPAKEVGGDLFDVIRVSDDRMVVAVGDVSGKGIPAALFMAVTTTLLRTVAKHRERPEGMLSRVNDDLCTLNPHTMFVTLLCAVFDLRRGRVTWASAGHLPPVLVRAGVAPAFLFEEQGTLAGIMPGIEIHSHTMDLEPGDTVVLYTDGITEAFDKRNELFGDQRVLTFFAEHPVRTAADAADGLLQAVHRHESGTPQSDDITVVAVRWAGRPEATRPGAPLERTWRFRSTTDDLMRAQEEMQTFWAGHGMPDEIRADLRLVLDELLSNIVGYGYGHPNGHIEVETRLLSDRVRLAVRDWSHPFNPLEQPAPDLSGDPDDRPVGGLGIHLVRQLMDTIEYSHDGARNELMLERRLAARPGRS
jgi:serine phosphatase RsbU (regulator of sigma subunit)/anti-sigma regulatory factor (Ser/Thr protein kinase)